MQRSVLALMASMLISACTPSTTQAVIEDSVTLIIQFEATAEGLPAFAEIMNGVPEAMKSEEGFVSATIYQKLDEPEFFVLTEVWKSRELHLEHFDRIVASGDWAHIKSLLRREPVMGYYASGISID